MKKTKKLLASLLLTAFALGNLPVVSAMAGEEPSPNLDIEISEEEQPIVGDVSNDEEATETDANNEVTDPTEESEPTELVDPVSPITPGETIEPTELTEPNTPPVPDIPKFTYEFEEKSTFTKDDTFEFSVLTDTTREIGTMTLHFGSNDNVAKFNAKKVDADSGQKFTVSVKASVFGKSGTYSFMESLGQSAYAEGQEIKFFNIRPTQEDIERLTFNVSLPDSEKVPSLELNKKSFLSGDVLTMSFKIPFVPSEVSHFSLDWIDSEAPGKYFSFSALKEDDYSYDEDTGIYTVSYTFNGESESPFDAKYGNYVFSSINVSLNSGVGVNHISYKPGENIGHLDGNFSFKKTATPPPVVDPPVVNPPVVTPPVEVPPVVTPPVVKPEVGNIDLNETNGEELREMGLTLKDTDVLLDKIAAIKDPAEREYAETRLHKALQEIRLTEMIVKPVVPDNQPKHVLNNDAIQALNIPEALDRDVKSISIALKSEPVSEQKLAEYKAANDKIFQVYDMELIKTVIRTNDAKTEDKIHNNDIVSYVTLRIPIPSNSKNYTAVYIDDSGEVRNLTSAKIVTESGARFVEFLTDHFSLYGVMEIEGELEVPPVVTPPVVNPPIVTPPVEVKPETPTEDKDTTVEEKVEKETEKEKEKETTKETDTQDKLLKTGTASTLGFTLAGIFILGLGIVLMRKPVRA